MRSWPALEISFDDPASDELLHAALLDFNIAAIEETTLTAWRVFFHSPADRDRAALALAQQFPDLTIDALDVPDEDWAARSQASLKAIEIGNIIVAPPWDLPTVIIIQPSMGFGTGHHATTRLCLAALQHIDLVGRRVLDVGTGSGVLAIAASLLGAGRAIGIDDDPDAIQSARENAALNPAANVEMRVTDLRSMPQERFDVVLANLTGGLLVQTARQLQALTSPSGMLILSGFMDHEEEAVRAAFSGLALRSRTNEDEWVCAVLDR